MSESRLSWIRRARVASGIAMLVLAASSPVNADDDGTGPPPNTPGPGYIGLYPNPTLPEGYLTDQSTSPYGITSIFNMSAASSLRLSQSFTPRDSHIDWAAFVIQSTNQGGAAGPASYRVTLARGLNPTTGLLTDVLASTPPVSIPLGSQGWFRFEFDSSVPLTPGTRYILALEYVDGYTGGPNPQTGGTGLGAGGRRNSVYSGGNAHHYWDSTFGISNLTSVSNDLIFATGRIAPPFCIGDADGSGTVDFDDITAVLSNFGTSAQPGAAGTGDANNDGGVNFDDITTVLSSFGAAC